MDKYKIVKRIECSTCHGAGKFEHTDGDVEWCTLCGRRGYWEREASIEEVLADNAVTPPAAVVATDKASAALELAHEYFAEGTPATATAAAILAVAEQLAAMNETMARFHEFFVMSR